MKKIVEQMVGIMEAIQKDIVKEGNKAAQARVRKATIEFEKLGKEYRKASIAEAKK